MKKVKTNLSPAKDKVTSRKCAAFFSAAVLAVTSVTCIAQYSFDRPVFAQTNSERLNGREVFELSESYLSRNGEKTFTMLELTGEFPAIEEESESVKLIEELLTQSETDNTTTKEVVTEKTTQTVVTKVSRTESTTEALETTTEEKQTITETQVAVDSDSSKTSYTFDELGLSQVSEIEVPDDILFDANGVPLNYKKKLTGRSTAYCMGHTTATGTSVHPGVVAVNPRIIPYGSKMYIVASDGQVYGYSSAEDTGGFIYWNNAPIVDLYMWSSNSCYSWGNRQVTIYIF